MQQEIKHDEPLSPEIQDVMKNLISAMRIVKIYPSNNPIYFQSVKKAYDSLSHFLEASPEYQVGIQKNYFTYQHAPFGKDTQVNKAIVQDLFAKGIREILFSADVTEAELLELCQALALSSEELAMKSGISTILWEKGATHIKVTEAGLDEVITAKAEGGWEITTETGAPSGEPEAPKERKQEFRAAKTLVLGDVKTDPEGFGASMIAYAMRTRTEYESVEDRLYTLYQQAGSKIRKDHATESEILFDGLAKSVLALDPAHRDGFIAGKLYGDLDRELSVSRDADDDLQAPGPLHEIRTGRFTNTWNVQQVATLLKRSASKQIIPPAPPPPPDQLQAVPIAGELAEIARGLEEDSHEQVEALKAVSSAGMESDIIEAAARTLISLIPLVKNPRRAGTAEKELSLFSGVVHQLEDMLSYLLKKNSYDLATVILKALHMPVGPEFQPRMMEALKKTATKPIIKSTITDMRTRPKGSPEYQSAYTYLASLDKKATEALLELMTEENDHDTRIFLLELMKEFGRNQLALLGEYITDERWYVVRNIVSILAESKTDQALALLRKAADHKNVQIRQEVIKALVSTGGKKASAVLAKFLRDPDAVLHLEAVTAFADMPGIGAEEAKPLIDYLEGRALNAKEQELTLAAIKTLGKIGGWDAGEFLKGYSRIRWWKSRKLQAERRAAALRAMEEIKKRGAHGGREQR